MLSMIKKWWNKNDQRFADLESSITQLTEAKLEQEQKSIQLAAEKEALVSEIDVLRTAVIDKNTSKDSNEPWVNVQSADFDKEHGLKIDLDWNDAFITYLKASGLKGKTDEIIIQKWLAFLYEDVITKMEDETTEESMASSDPSEGEFV